MERTISVDIVVEDESQLQSAHRAVVHMLEESTLVKVITSYTYEGNKALSPQPTTERVCPCLRGLQCNECREHNFGRHDTYHPKGPEDYFSHCLQCTSPRCKDGKIQVEETK